MKELFDLLGKRERQILALFCVLLTASLIFYQGIALRQKRTYRQSVGSLPTQQKEFEKIKELNREIKMESLRWDEARQDIADIEKKYFYRQDKNINALRLDLRRIFRRARIRVTSDLLFDYADWEKELKRARVSFTLAGSYVALKRFIHQVEIHPKFLMIERIDFRDIDTQSGQIELNIVLAGYYAN
jgi:hypothetical protein